MAGSGSQPVFDDAPLAIPHASPGEPSARLDASPHQPVANESEPARNRPARSGPADVQTPAVESSESAEPTEPSAPASAPTRWQRAWQAAASLLHSRSTPGFLVSLILHTALLLTLALMTIAGTGRGGMGASILQALASEDADQVVEMLDPKLASGAVHDDASDSADAESFMATPGAQTVMGGTFADGLENLARFADNGSGQVAQAPQSAAGLVGEALSSSMNASMAHVGVDGRKPESRRRLALERGGSGDSEAAVELALEWLVAHQRPNGGWGLDHRKRDCGPYCTHPGSGGEQYNPAATGLALLAFLGAGYTHKDGKYTEVVKRGLYQLMSMMEKTTHGASFLFNSPQGMYNQGIATFALCEAYQLSGDSTLKDPAQEAIDFIVAAQNDQGGWGYMPNRPGDLTLTGWQTMALKSADSAGLYIPAPTILRIDQFLDSQGDKAKTFYGYQAPTPKNETCTAIALILRMFRGWPHSDPRVLDGAIYLERQGISSHDIYRNYYVTLLLFHVGGRTFDEWNPRMRDSLVQSQDRAGHAKGSWYFDDKWCEVGGRLYTTAMAAMTLEVYYRFSPIYLNSDKPFEF